MPKFTEQEKQFLLQWVTKDLYTTPFVLTNQQTADGWRFRLGQLLDKYDFAYTGNERQTKLKNLQEKLKTRFIQSRVEPGYAAGAIMGMSIGNATTQFNLKLKGTT